MPRYFFDLHEQGQVLPDETGIECLDHQDALNQAACVLARIAADDFSLGRLAGERSITIRQQGQGHIAEATLELHVRPAEQPRS